MKTSLSVHRPSAEAETQGQDPVVVLLRANGLCIHLQELGGQLAVNTESTWSQDSMDNLQQANSNFPNELQKLLSDPEPS